MTQNFDLAQIRRLVAFGDSWTAGHGVETDPRYQDIARPEPFVENLRRANSWPRWLSARYDIPMINMGQAGVCNVGIKRTIHENLGFLDPKHDLVLVMWSFPYRHHLWIHTCGADEIALLDILRSTQTMLAGYNYFWFNSFWPTFDQEPHIQADLDMSRFLAPQHTAAQVLRAYEEANDCSVWEYDSRNVHEDAHGFSTGDYHPNLLGYRITAQWIWDLLEPYHRSGDAGA